MDTVIHRDQTPAAQAEVNVCQSKSAGPADREETAENRSASRNKQPLKKTKERKKEQKEPKSARGSNRRSAKPQRNNAKPSTPRQSKNSNLVASEVGCLVAELQGAKDALVDKRKVEEEEERDQKKKEKGEKKKLVSAAFARGASSPINFSSRPAMNFGYRYRGMSAFGKDTSRQYFYGTASFMVASVLMPFVLPLSVKLFSLQFEPVSVKLKHSVRTVSHEDSSLLSATGEVVDARPSETKIGDGELTQIVSTAEFEFPARLVAVEQDNLLDNEEATVFYKHDDSLLKRAVGKLMTVSNHVLRVWRGTKHYANLGNDFVSSFFSSLDYYQSRDDRIEAAADALATPEQLLNADERREAVFVSSLVEPWFSGPTAHIAKAVDGHTFIGPQGNVVNIYNFMLLAANALLDVRSPVYFSSCTAKEVEKPLADRKFSPYVYDKAVERIDYCAHSYHNAATYGSMSSQISPDVNFSMIYRKLSRYTSINQNRFGQKDLLCNAEQIARLQFWAVREGNIARSSRSHF